MTLVVTAATHNFIAQASDRRFTRPNGELFRDDANKAVIVDCQDGTLALAYSGLGFIDPLRTDDWVVEVLSRRGAASMRADEAVSMLAEQATQVVAKMTLAPQVKRISFYVAEWPKAVGLTPGVWLISNFETFSSPPRKDSAFHVRATKRSAVASPTFQVGCIGLRREVKNGYIVLVGGSEQAVIHPQKRLRKLRDFLLRSREPAGVTQKLVNFIRRCADDPDEGKYIGRNCMAVFLSDHDRRSVYYDEDSSRPDVFAPNFVRLGGPAIRDLMWGPGKGPSIEEIQRMIDDKRKPQKRKGQ